MPDNSVTNAPKPGQVTTASPPTETRLIPLEKEPDRSSNDSGATSIVEAPPRSFDKQRRAKLERLKAAMGSSRSIDAEEIAMLKRAQEVIGGGSNAATKAAQTETKPEPKDQGEEGVKKRYYHPDDGAVVTVDVAKARREVAALAQGIPESGSDDTCLQQKEGVDSGDPATLKTGQLDPEEIICRDNGEYQAPGEVIYPDLASLYGLDDPSSIAGIEDAYETLSLEREPLHRLLEQRLDLTWDDPEMQSAAFEDDPSMQGGVFELAESLEPVFIDPEADLETRTDVGFGDLFSDDRAEPLRGSALTGHRLSHPPLRVGPEQSTEPPEDGAAGSLARTDSPSSPDRSGARRRRAFIRNAVTHGPDDDGGAVVPRIVTS